MLKQKLKDEEKRRRDEEKRKVSNGFFDTVCLTEYDSFPWFSRLIFILFGMIVMIDFLMYWVQIGNVYVTVSQAYIPLLTA